MTKVGEYLKIRDAATVLGVSSMTLRNWDKQDKLKPHRNPINGYRLYKKEDLLRVLKSIECDMLSRAKTEKEVMARR